jgi:putative transposase
MPFSIRVPSLITPVHCITQTEEPNILAAGLAVSVCRATIRPEQSKSVKAGAKNPSGPQAETQIVRFGNRRPFYGGEDVNLSCHQEWGRVLTHRPLIFGSKMGSKRWKGVVKLKDHPNQHRNWNYFDSKDCIASFIFWSDNANYWAFDKSSRRSLTPKSHAEVRTGVGF